MSHLEKVLDNDKKFEDYANKHSQGYEDSDRAMQVVRQFIIKKKLIIYGGMAIDLQLKAAGHKGIYKPDAVPDYDFMSPNYYNDANELAALLHKKGFKNCQAINAIHVSTRKVRTDFIWVADITYVPLNIFKNVPTMQTKDGLRFVHPNFQRLDLHRAMSLPFENPPQEVLFFRGRKDQKRFRLIDQHYPIKVVANAKVECISNGEMVWKVPIGYLTNNVIGGTQAYCTIWWAMNQLLNGKSKLAKTIDSSGKITDTIRKKFAELPSGGMEINAKDITFKLGFKCPRMNTVNIITDDFEELLGKLPAGAAKSARYYNKYYDEWRPRTVVAQNDKVSLIEIFDNHPRRLPAWDFGDVCKMFDIKFAGTTSICTPQYVLLYYIQKYFGGGFKQDGSLDRAEQKVFLKMYRAMYDLIVLAEEIYMELVPENARANPNNPTAKIFAELPFFLTHRAYGKNNWSSSYIVGFREQNYMVKYVPRDQRQVMKPQNYYLDNADKPPPAAWDPTVSEFYQFDGLERKKPFEPAELL